MSFLRGSTNYVWCTTSVLGKGATGAVFQVWLLFFFHLVKIQFRRIITNLCTVEQPPPLNVVCVFFLSFSFNFLKGVNKHNGEPVAVKTFNQMSHMRPIDVQMREFEVLQKVNHENIVKLLAIEDDQEGRGKVRVLLFHANVEEKSLFTCSLVSLTFIGDCNGIMYGWQLIQYT